MMRFIVLIGTLLISLSNGKAQTELEKLVVEKINEHRTEDSKVALNLGDELGNSGSRHHSKYMREHGVGHFEIRRFDGELKQRAYINNWLSCNSEVVSYVTCSNIMSSDQIASKIVECWMKSLIHKHHLLAAYENNTVWIGIDTNRLSTHKTEYYSTMNLGCKQNERKDLEVDKQLIKINKKIRYE